MSDTDRLRILLGAAGTLGVHSHEIRREGISGNPSQRAKDLVTRGIEVSKRRENVGRRQGIRYWLAEHAPPDAQDVRPNNKHEPPRCQCGCGAPLEEMRVGAVWASDACRMRAQRRDNPNKSRTPTSSPNSALFDESVGRESMRHDREVA
jgi:hypothetical protein